MWLILKHFPNKSECEAILNYFRQNNAEKNFRLIHLDPLSMVTPRYTTCKSPAFRKWDNSFVISYLTIFFTPSFHKQFIRKRSIISISRIQRCRRCSNIFWAKRLDAKACSKKCSDVLSQRKRQRKIKRNKEKINEQRRKNYSHNKKLKEIKEKKNGTL